MFLLGCLILCLPHFEKKNSPSDWRAIFKNNAMMAGGLETFMLIFAEIALGMRPLFYGFIRYAVLGDGEGLRGDEAPREQAVPRTEAEGGP